MNKISKKIVALATMAAFVLTLVPAAAFADTYTGDPTKSTVKTAYATPDVAIDEQVVLTANIYESNGYTVADMDNVRIWAEDEQERVVTGATFNGESTTQDGVYDYDWSAATENGVVSGTLKNEQTFAVKFAAAGTYTIHVGQLQKQADGTSKVVEFTFNEDYQTINVLARTPNAITFTKDDTQHSNLPTEKNVITLDILTNFAGFEVGGVDTLTIKGNVTAKDGKPVDNATITMSADKTAIELAKTETTTDNQGNFDVTFALKDFVNGNITVKCGDLTYVLKVVAAKANAQTITTSLEDGYVLAGTDSLWNKGDYRSFADAVQFEIKDQKGELVTGDGLEKTEPAFGIGNVAGYQHENFVSIDEKPTKSTLTAGDLIVKWDNAAGAYTLYYKSGDAAKDLVPGKYTVSVGLLSHNSATATFNVAEYGTTQDMTVTMQAKPYGSANTEYYNITDEIALGDDLRLVAKYVDENGIKIPASDAEYGADGKAVEGRYSTLNPTQFGDLTNVFKLYSNSVVYESLIGTTIDVKVYDDTVKKLVQEKLTVVDAYDTYTLAFNPTEGDVNKDNKVAVSVVDADENLANKVDGTLYAYIADQSDKDAKVSVSVNDTVKNGKGSLEIYSDKETTVDVVVAVKSGAAIYAATLEYTVGAEDPYANQAVVMTIGSTDYVVNNEIISGDAAPYVDSAWRTMVPFRVLGETFGAKVAWDQDAQTVTYTYGDTELVMTIGEDTYTLNGEEQTMDTAPVLSGDRTYVPVRFVAEDLGYTVTALQDGETGLTASVVFQK